MKNKLFLNKVSVRRSKTHGYGVFADKLIRKGERIEECYTLITRGKDKGLEDYYFDANRKYAVPTGYGVIYNHSDHPNADYVINRKTKIMTIRADKTIKKNEEIYISYGKAYFTTRGLTPKKHK